MTNVVCESYNSSWFVFHNCRLKAVGRDKVVLNINETILYPVNNAQAHLKMYKRENGFKPWLLDTTVDACRFMRRQYNPVAKIVYSLFQPFTNINHTCPFVVSYHSFNIEIINNNVKYVFYKGPQILEGFYLKPELLLLPFPTGQYMLALRWFFDKKLQFDTNVSFLFVEDFSKE
ncbi:uncharacterized protein LOC108104269 [Drosophila eugracilis]|uniref:uncharacterized protein LOC108104269 n=1 Tax=Drosophila eugracilis TaxID=29029 RepID=UPI0007E82563|nr:uncharacterized protein LOC108104269 [Drosophila eugracilis]